MATNPPPPTQREGDSGPLVRVIQAALNNNGFNVGAADGDFGPKTKQAVMNFQRSRGLGADGIVGPMTWAALGEASGGTSSGTGTITAGGPWGGSQNVANAAKAIAADMRIPVTSQKRNLADTHRVGSSISSDHYTGNTTAFAVDFGVAGARGDQLARAIATKYGIPQGNIGTFNSHVINVTGAKYRLQLLWRVKGHFDHVHLGIRRA